MGMYTTKYRERERERVRHVESKASGGDRCRDVHRTKLEYIGVESTHTRPQHNTTPSRGRRTGENANWNRLSKIRTRMVVDKKERKRKVGKQRCNR